MDARGVRSGYDRHQLWDLAFSPKRRSSLAVYYFIVPEEETADAYPNSRIVYLKFTSSITGWNPSEDLLAAKKAAEEAGTWDDLQRTLWEVVISSGWAATYWPCLGAIMQLATLWGMSIDLKEAYRRVRLRWRQKNA